MAAELSKRESFVVIDDSLSLEDGHEVSHITHGGTAADAHDMRILGRIQELNV
jgi:hypothetical protein